MRKNTNIRTLNGIASALIVGVFFLHAAFGSSPGLSGLWIRIAPLVWIGVAIIAVHVALSVATSVQQLTDTVRPPSSAKKRHLVLKWVTGVLLAAAAVAHAGCVHAAGAGAVHATATGTVLAVCVLVLLTWHVCVGTKSLLKDLNIDRRYRTLLRVVVCVLAICIGTVLLAYAVRL